MPNLFIDSATRLRSLGLEDSTELFALIDANRKHLREWLGWLDATVTERDLRVYIESVQSGAIEGSNLICCIEHERALVGNCGFKSVDKLNRSAEIGYWLAKSAMGQGTMTRAVDTMLEYGFLEFDLNRIELRADKDNRGSRAIAERLGFVLEGELRDAEWRYGEPNTLVVYSLLRREWEAAMGEEAGEEAQGLDEDLALATLLEDQGAQTLDAQESLGEKALKEELESGELAHGKALEFKCPACSRQIFNRRLANCEFCGEQVPQELLLSKERREELDSARSKRAAHGRQRDRDMRALKRIQNQRRRAYGTGRFPGL
jgi:ribosomal-protein-serine acetyltransferase